MILITVLCAVNEEIWSAVSTTQAQEVREQLQPCEVGTDVHKAQHREDVMILPCTVKPNSKGQLVPHVALHQHQHGAYHPIGGKVGGQDGHRKKTLPMALQREFLAEATDDEDTTRKLT